MKKSKISLLLVLISIICLLVSCKNEPETKKYNVNFYDGNSVLFHQTVESGKKVARPINPTKDGFIFDNWYQDTSLTQVYDFNSPVNSDKALYAKWNTTPTPVAEKYSVSFNANGGSGSMATVFIQKGSTYTVQDCTFTYAGYEFSTWNDGTNDVPVGSVITVNGNITLTAQWTYLPTKIISPSDFNAKLKNKMNGTPINELVFRTGQPVPATIADSDLMSAPDSLKKVWLSLSSEGTTLNVNTDSIKFVFSESVKGIFKGLSNLESIDVSGIDTSKVTDMEKMFYDCRGLTELDVSGFDTSQVTVMNWMFCGCSDLTSLITGNNFSVDKVFARDNIFSSFATSTGEHTVVVPNADTMAAFYGDGTNGWIGEGWTQDGINLKKTV